MSTLFISDLHLDPSRPAVTRAFFDLLEQQAASADALYILGDFFEAWVGDDDDSDLACSVSAALRGLTDRGVSAYLMHGNRDFLIGEEFCSKSGCQLIDDPTVIDLYGHRALLMHGDSLCTDDHEYMAFRAQCRSPEWQQAILSRSLEQRRQLAQQLRADSREANSNKAEDIMDVNAAAVREALQDYDVDLLIHGHTHRPAQHTVTCDQGEATRVVLGDWDRYRWWLVYTADHSFSLKYDTIGH